MADTTITTKAHKKNNVKPTKLQRKTFEILKENPDMPLGKAMLMAGYSKKVAIAPTANFLERRGTEIAMEEWRHHLQGTGITAKYLAQKHKEWLEAEKIVTSPTEPDKLVPDYQTQLKAAEMIRKDLGITQQTDNPENIKRRIVAEEFFES